ncbi:MAG: HlyC/CorC family transporter [Phycisphaerales bacterium]|nr:HlyC/CorC family transporter [Phycisphaerales bacterium]
MELLILLFLVVINGVFSMSEIAVVSSRELRLAHEAEKGDAGARAALRLRRSPTMFLSTVQVGITLIGILSGAFGEAAIADNLRRRLEAIPLLAEHARLASFILMVLIVTGLSLVLGELVPKRLAMSRPEAIAKAVAAPMALLSRVIAVPVTLLTWLTDMLLRPLGIRAGGEQQSVTEEEVRAMLRLGAATGVFHAAESALVEDVFTAADRTAGDAMVPRTEMAWLNLDEPWERSRHRIRETKHSHYPVCKGRVDQILGVVHVKDLLSRVLSGETIDLARLATKPLYVPETAPLLKVLELFRSSRAHVAFVVDEYGAIEGLITLNDIVTRIMGQIPRAGDHDQPAVVTRPDGSFLLDGRLDLDRLKELMGIPELPRESEGGFHSVGGFLMTALGRLPDAGDTHAFDRYTFEILDMDGKRIDKVLLTIRPQPPAEDQSE